MKKLLIVFSILFTLAANLIFAGDTTYGNVVVSRVISVYDGDTFKVDIDEWPAIIGHHISIRVYGIDTPEIKGETPYERRLARKAKQLTKLILLGAHKIELRDIRRGKYFRIVADVYVDGKRLADILLERGLAKPYYGGKKQSW